MFQQQPMPMNHVLYESKDLRHQQPQNRARVYDEPKDRQDTKKSTSTHEKKNNELIKITYQAVF